MGRVHSINPGTVAAPAFSFKEQPNTGIYLAEAGKLGFSVGGEAKMFLTGTTRSFVPDAGYAIDLPRNDEEHVPASPVQGMMYCQAADNSLKVYDGTDWRRFAFTIPGITSTENSIARFQGGTSVKTWLADSGVVDDASNEWITVTDFGIRAGNPGDVAVISFTSDPSTGLWYDTSASVTVLQTSSVKVATIDASSGVFSFFFDCSVYLKDVIAESTNFSDGTAEDPSVSFVSYPADGFFFVDSSEIHVGQNGSGLDVRSDSVQIGTSLTLGVSENYKDLYCDDCLIGLGSAGAPSLTYTEHLTVGLYNDSGDMWFISGSSASNVWVTHDPCVWNIGQASGSFLVNDVVLVDGAFIDVTKVGSTVTRIDLNSYSLRGGDDGLELYSGTHTVYKFCYDGAIRTDFIYGSASFNFYGYDQYDITVSTLISSDSDVTLSAPAESGDYQIGVDSSGNVIYDSSSARYKKDLSPASQIYCLEVINKLRPVSFNFKMDNSLSVGFIAEEVVSIFPEVVFLDKNDTPSSIDYGRLSVLPILVLKSIKTQLDSFESSFVWDSGGVPFDVSSHTADLKELKEAEEKSRLSVEELEKEFASLSEELLDLSRRASVN